MLYDFFINHCLSEKEILAIPIYDILKRVGFSVFIDVSEIYCGDHIYEKIIEKINQSNWCISIIGENFLNKEWPKKELELFLDISKQTKQNNILPLFHEVEKEKVFSTFPQLTDIAYETSDMFSNELLLETAICRFISSYFNRITINVTWESILDKLKCIQNKRRNVLHSLIKNYLNNVTERTLSLVNLYNITGYCILSCSEINIVPTREMSIGFNYIQEKIQEIYNNIHKISIHDIKVAEIIAQNSAYYIINTLYD
jgi:hypothetical protein